MRHFLPRAVLALAIPTTEALAGTFPSKCFGNVGRIRQKIINDSVLRIGAA